MDKALRILRTIFLAVVIGASVCFIAKRIGRTPAYSVDWMDYPKNAYVTKIEETKE